MSQEHLLDRFRAELTRSKKTQAAAAKEIGIAPATLTQLLNGSYGADPASQYEKLEKWLEQQAQAHAARNQLPPAPGFVMTITSERIMAGIGFAQNHRDITLIYGGAGVGKTETLLEYQRSFNNVWLVTASPATSTTPAILEEIALAMGFKQMPFGSSRLQREIIRKMTGTNGVLLIDDAQSLNINALDTIRTIYDATKIGVVLCGNESVYSRMSGNRAAYLDRLHSRIGKYLPLRRPLPADVDDLVAAQGISDAKIHTLLREVAKKSGALRLVAKVLQSASMFAAGSVPELKHVEAAIKDLGV